MKTTTFILAGLMLAASAIAPALAETASSSPSPFAMSQAVADNPGHPRIPMAIWAPVSGKGLGLVVMSHGTGAGPAAHIDTAQALASAGFVVVAPMHPGDNFQDESSVGKPQWFADRSRHISKVLDYMLGHWPDHGRIDHGRVGMFGMSAGATTALILAGGKIDLGLVAEHCQKQPEFVCQIMAPVVPGTPTVEMAKDKRIAAVVLAAPGLGFAFEPQSLRMVTVPVQLWVGSEDQTVPYATNAGLVRSHLGGKVEFHLVENAVHLSFLAPCGPDSPPVICQDNPGFDRALFHQGFNRDIVDFFQAKLPARAQHDR